MPKRTPRFPTVLTVDVGNTHTGIGVFRDGGMDRFWRIASRDDVTGDELLTVLEPLLRADLLDLRRDRAVIIGSVVPALTDEFRSAVRNLIGIEAVVVSPRIRLGVKLEVTDPSTVGADRIANAAAAVERGKLPAIVVDLGTATNFDVVDEQKRYLGGVIAPGLVTSAENLFRRAARLTKVEFRQPPKFIGKTTEECLQAGLFYGSTGQIDGIVQGIQKELGKKKAHVIATGGLASAIAKASKTIKEVDPGLTLKGLHRILMLNHG
jgi:type III pantothenate kinase